MFPLLDSLGAERALVAVAWLALGASVLVARRAALASALAAALFLAVAFAQAPQWFAFPPERSGQLAVVLAKAGRIEAEHPEETVLVDRVFSRWDPTARVDVYELSTSIGDLEARPVETLFFVQDAERGHRGRRDQSHHDRARPPELRGLPRSSLRPAGGGDPPARRAQLRACLGRALRSGPDERRRHEVRLRGRLALDQRELSVHA